MSKCRLHHISITIADFDWYKKFFEKIFEMKVQRTGGDEAHRQLWFEEGIQLVEKEDSLCGSYNIDHVSLGVEDIPATVAAAVKEGCTTSDKGAHWFVLPNGVQIELKPY